MFVLEALWKWLVVTGSMRLGDADRIQSSDDSEHSKGAYMVNQSQDHVGYAHGTNDSYFFTLLMTLVGHWRSISVWRSAWYCLWMLVRVVRAVPGALLEAFELQSVSVLGSLRF